MAHQGANPKFEKEHEFQSSPPLGIALTTGLLAVFVPALLHGSFVVRQEKKSPELIIEKFSLQRAKKFLVSHNNLLYMPKTLPNI